MTIVVFLLIVVTLALPLSLLMYMVRDSLEEDMSLNTIRKAIHHLRRLLSNLTRGRFTVRTLQPGDKIIFKKYNDKKKGTVLGTRIDKPSKFFISYTETHEEWVDDSDLSIDTMEMIKATSDAKEEKNE